MNYKLILTGLSMAVLAAGANASIEYTLKEFSGSGSTNLSSSPTTATPDVVIGTYSGYATYSLDYLAASTSVISSGSIALTYSNVAAGGMYAVDISAYTTTGVELGSTYKTGSFSGSGVKNFNFSFASTTDNVIFKTSELVVGSGTATGGSTATPEPASYAVMGLGLVGLVIRRRRR